MIYTDAGRYALRALIHLAQLDTSGSPLTAAEIADAEELPASYLAKVLKELAEAGFLVSVRGRNGGFRLAVAAEDISVLAVLDTTDDLRRRLDGCVLGLEGCTAEASCGLHSYWHWLRGEAARRLDRLSVADLRAERDGKRRAE